MLVWSLVIGEDFFFKFIDVFFTPHFVKGYMKVIFAKFGFVYSPLSRAYWVLKYDHRW